MGLFYGTTNKKATHELFMILLQEIQTIRHPVKEIIIDQYLRWNGPPLRPIEKKVFEVNELEDNLKESGGKSIEIKFSQTFYYKQKDLSLNGILLLEAHPKKIADISIQYFFPEPNFGFDEFIQDPIIWDYFYENFIRQSIEDKNHSIVTKIQVGENAFPLDNSTSAIFVYYSNRSEFILNLLTNYPKYQPHEDDLICQGYENQYRRDLGEIFCKDILDFKIYNNLEAKICANHLAKPILSSFLLKREDNTKLTNCMKDLFHELFSIYMDYYQPKKNLEGMIRKRI